MSEELNKKSGKAALWSTVTEIMAKLITPIVNIVLARLLTPDAFGAVATITMVITFAEIFTDAGFQKYIIQHEFDSEDSLNKSTNVAFITNLSVSTLIVAIIAIFRNQIASLVGSPELGNAIAVASLVIILVAFSSIQMARFKRDFDFKTLFFVRIVSSLIPLFVTVPLAFVLRNFWALVIGNLAVNLFNAVALTVKSKWKPKLFYSFALFKKMFSFTAWTMLESVLIWLTTNVDIFIVGNVLSDYYLGIYKTSITTVNSYMGIITASIVPVLFSTLSRYQNDEDNFHATFWKFQRYMSWLVIPMSIGVFVFRDLITELLLGSQWKGASGFIGLWGLMSGFTIIFSNLASEVYRSKGNPKLSMLSQAIHIAFVIPAVLLTVNLSFETLYTARALIRIQFVVWSIIILRVIYKFSIKKMLSNVSPAVISALIMGVVGYILSNFMTAIWWQFVCIFICIIVYFAVLLALFPKTRKEIFDIPFISKFINKIAKRGLK